MTDPVVAKRMRVVRTWTALDAITATIERLEPLIAALRERADEACLAALEAETDAVLREQMHIGLPLHVAAQRLEQYLLAPLMLDLEALQTLAALCREPALEATQPPPETGPAAP